MRLVVTGGGTGGHIYPALEIARAAAEAGAEIAYLGSFRGQESAICQSRGVQFQGFNAQPLYSLRQVRGWKSLGALLLARSSAKRYLSINPPDCVFSTGGYSAAPVMAAARSLRIPYVVHEANSVPGRSNRLFATAATAFTCVFNATLSVIPTAIRTGQPIRRELRSAAEVADSAEVKNLVFGLGGSQGSEFLNRTFPQAAGRYNGPLNWLLVTGRDHFPEMSELARNNLQVKPYLESPELISAYRRAKVFIGRSGGTLAEIAMFGIPSVLMPLPTSADDHQLKNAEEFVAMGAAKLVRQGDESIDRMVEYVNEWAANDSFYEKAQVALRQWDRPDATDRILQMVLKGRQ